MQISYVTASSIYRGTDLKDDNTQSCKIDTYHQYMNTKLHDDKSVLLLNTTKISELVIRN
jgi:hypothetical protein